MHYLCKEAIKDHEALGYHNSEAGKSLDRKATKNILVKEGECIYICIITVKPQGEQMMCHSSRMNLAIQKRVSPCVSPREGVRTDAVLGVTGKCLCRHPSLHQGQTWFVYWERALRQDFQLVLLQASTSLAESFSR